MADSFRITVSTAPTDDASIEAVKQVLNKMKAEDGFDYGELTVTNGELNVEYPNSAGEVDRAMIAASEQFQETVFRSHYFYGESGYYSAIDTEMKAGIVFSEKGEEWSAFRSDSRRYERLPDGTLKGIMSYFETVNGQEEEHTLSCVVNDYSELNDKYFEARKKLGRLKLEVDAADPAPIKELFNKILSWGDPEDVRKQLHLVADFDACRLTAVGIEDFRDGLEDAIKEIIKEQPDAEIHYSVRYNKEGNNV